MQEYSILDFKDYLIGIIKMARILLTGGSGLLGTELRRHLDFIAPTHSEMDILKPETYVKNDFDIVVHAAAYIKQSAAENEDKMKCYMTNVLATKWLCEFYRGAKFVYISSEYAFNPVNWYSNTKKWGEDVVKNFAKDFLIIRTLFKPRPFPHDKACVDQWTYGDYVDVIAPMIIANLHKDGIIHLGTGRKTTYELAKQTKPDVIPCLVDDITSVKLPKDYIL